MADKIKPSMVSISKRLTLQRKNTLVEDMEENVECASQDLMKEKLKQGIMYSKELININVSINYMLNRTLLFNDYVYIYNSLIFPINNSQ